VLPTKTDCTVKLQQNVVDTSGGVPLKLGDKFSSFELVTCGEQTCLENLIYDIDIKNAGTRNMQITKVDFTFNNVSESLLKDVKLNPLLPGQETSLAPTRAVNVCSGGKFDASVRTETNSTGLVCVDDSFYNFEL
jgi:hypothetical protein